MREHRVVFFSPGTFVAENSTLPIPEWDTRIAARMAASIRERHDAIPYGFRFETVLVAPPVPDGEGGTLTVNLKVVATSPMHYLNGKIETLADVEARNDPSEGILRENMRCNGYAEVITTKNGYRWTQPAMPGDKIVDADGTVTATWEGSGAPHEPSGS